MEWFPELPGGLNRVFYDLTRFLPENGIEVTGLVTGSSQVVRESAGKVVAVCGTAAPLAVRLREFRRHAAGTLCESISLVVGHFALYTLPLLGLLRDRALVVHFQGPWAMEAAREGAGWLTTKWRWALERAVYRRGHRIITLSTAFAHILERSYRVPSERIRVVPAGIDVSAYAPRHSRDDARDVLGWHRDRPVVLAVRRLVRRMGLEDLVAAAEVVRRTCPEVLFLIAGSGPLRDELRSRISARGLQDHVRLLGRLAEDQLPVAYHAADLTIVPTTALEGFGLIAVESLAAGTPVLVTPVGGLPEVVEGLSPALVLEGVGAAPVAAGLIAALGGTLRLPPQHACREYALAHFDCRRMAVRVAEVYREATG